VSGLEGAGAGAPASSALGAALLWVPTAYFLQGLPYNVVTSTAQLYLQDLGVEKTRINVALGSMLLVWSLKPLWAPLVDAVGRKRFWVLGMQLAGAALLALLALGARLPPDRVLPAATALLWAVSVVSATHDIALDGFYMLALDERAQAALSGLRVAAWRLSLIFAGGGLVAGVGALRARLGWGVAQSWTAGLLLCAAITAALALLHAALFPRPPGDRPAGEERSEAAGVVGGDEARAAGGAGREGRNASGGGRALDLVDGFLRGFLSYLRQPGAARLVAFIVLARTAEALLGAMARLFLRDPPAKGGLGLSLEEVGLVYGTVGVIALLAGGVLGGVIVARAGLRRSLLPLFLALNAPDLAYVYLANAGPGVPLGLVAALVGLEQLGYGLGSGAFAVVLLRAARPPFQTTHYAISTGVMTLTVSLATLASGWAQERLGYAGYFALVCAAAVPSVLSVRLLGSVLGEESGEAARG
jgi:PAT family beta-lactamase induction signal transducer AmpG